VPRLLRQRARLPATSGRHASLAARFKSSNRRTPGPFHSTRNPRSLLPHVPRLFPAFLIPALQKSRGPGALQGLSDDYLIWPKPSRSARPAQRGSSDISAPTQNDATDARSITRRRSVSTTLPSQARRAPSALRDDSARSHDNTPPSLRRARTRPGPSLLTVIPPARAHSPHRPLAIGARRTRQHSIPFRAASSDCCPCSGGCAAPAGVAVGQRLYHGPGRRAFQRSQARKGLRAQEQ
jgi:hypothetical protein